jgi:thermitase
MHRRYSLLSIVLVLFLFLPSNQFFTQSLAEDSLNNEDPINYINYEEMVELEKANAQLHGDIIPEEESEEIIEQEITKIKKAEFRPGEFLVKFKRGVSEKKKNAIHGKHGVKVKEKIKGIGVERLGIPKGKTVPGMLKVYKKNPNVEFAEPNFLARAVTTTPNDPYYSYQWALSKIQADEAWDIEKGSSAIIISIVDTGVDYTHPDLAAKVTYGYDFVNWDTDPIDDHGHGTHCAGIASAVTNNRLGIAGVSWDSQIMPFKVLNSEGRGYYSAVANGIIYSALWGSDVISLSLGGPCYSQTLEDAVNYAYERGCLIVAAAGNSGDNTLLYPAACNNVMGVAATNRNDERASFSSYGAHITISAPGVGIYSTITNDRYAFGSGTSMATPHIAGLAALVWSKKPDLTNYEVRGVIEQTADDLYSPGWDQYTGHGRINALKALQLLAPPPPEEPGTPPYLTLEKSADPREIYEATSHLTPTRTEMTITLEGAGDPVSTAPSQPVDVVLIIDQSGSMYGQKIEDAKKSAKLFIDQMGDNDRAALVSFTWYSHLRVGLTRTDAPGKSTLQAAIDRLSAGGGTNIPAALSTAHEELLDKGDSNRKWVEIILTDGMTVYSNLIDERTDPLITRAINSEITIYAIGLGYWVQTKLLRNIAFWSGGKYYYAPGSEDLLDIYEEIARQVLLSNLAGEDIALTEVLEDYINNEGNFSIVPDGIIQNLDGTTTLIWNIRTLSIGETWSVSFDLSSNQVGSDIPTDIEEDSRVTYTDYAENPAVLALPQTYLLVKAAPSGVEVANVFLTPRSLNVGRRAEHSFMIHVIPEQPIDVATGDGAGVFVDVDGNDLFEEDEQFEAIVSSSDAVDIAIKVYLGNSLKDNKPGVAIYSINNRNIIYPDGSDIDDLWLNTFTPPRKKSSGKGSK